MPKMQIYIENEFKKICDYKSEIPAVKINDFDVEESKHLLLEHIDNIEDEKTYIDLGGKPCMHCGAIGNLKQEGPNGNIIFMNCKTRYEVDEFFKDSKIEDLESKDFTGYSKNNYEVGDIVTCQMIKKTRAGYFISFGEKKGFIHKDNVSYKIMNKLDSENNTFEAKLIRINGEKNYWSMIGIPQ